MKIPPIETKKKKMPIDIDRARDRRTTVRLGGCLYPPRASASEDNILLDMHNIILHILHSLIQWLLLSNLSKVGFILSMTFPVFLNLFSTGKDVFIKPGLSSVWGLFIMGCLFETFCQGSRLLLSVYFFDEL